MWEYCGSLCVRGCTCIVTTLSDWQAHMHPGLQMSYAELLWIDHLGMYVRVRRRGYLPHPLCCECPFTAPCWTSGTHAGGAGSQRAVNCALLCRMQAWCQLRHITQLVSVQ